MGDSPVTNALKQVGGFGVGTIAALTSIKGGGLGPYLMNRQRLMSDPGFRATLAGSPFMSGVFGVTGGMGGPPPAAPGLPATAGGGGVVQPGDMVGPPPPGVRVAQPGELPTPTQFNVPGYQPGTPRMWQPNLPPYDPKQALEQQGLATAALGVASTDDGMRAQSKMVAGIPLNDQEIVAATSRARAVQALGGQGTVVKLDIPGMQTNVGSPYNFAAVGADEYPTAALAAAAAAAKGPGWTVQPSGRGTFLLSPPLTPQQLAQPAAPPTAQGGAPAAPPTQAAPPATLPPPAPTPPVPPPTPPPQAAAPPPRPPPPPPPPPRPAAPPSSFDMDAIVPHVVVPEGQTGFPSGAFDQGAPAPSPSAASGAFVQPAAPAPPPASNVAVYPAPQGFVFHHSGGTTLEGLRATLKDRGLGSEYLMDRDGTIYDYARPGSPHMQPNDRYGGIAPGLTNRNALGIEMVARNNADVTPAQVAAARQFMATNYPNTPVYGHGEVNPGHKQADEGMAAVNAIRAARRGPGPGVQLAMAAPPDERTVAFPSGAPQEMAAGAQLTVPVVAKPPVVQPPLPRAEPMPAPGGAPTVLTGPQNYPPGQQMPISSETRRTQEGEQIFKAPDTSNADVRAALTWAGITNIEQATPQKLQKYWETLRTLDRQRAMDKAEIDRTQKAVLEGDGAGLVSLMQAKNNINKLVADFPDPNKRAYYVGTLRYPADTLKSMFTSDPELAKFHTDVAQLGVPLEGGSAIGRMLGLPGGSAILPGEQSALRSVLPSGASEPATFEENLQAYRDTVDSSIAIRDFLRGRPAGATSVADINGFLTNYTDALAQRRLDALRPPPAAGAAPPAAGAAPPAAAAPPPAPAPTAPPPSATPWAPLATWTVQ